MLASTVVVVTVELLEVDVLSGALLDVVLLELELELVLLVLEVDVLGSVTLVVVGATVLTVVVLVLVVVVDDSVVEVVVLVLVVVVHMTQHGSVGSTCRVGAGCRRADGRMVGGSVR